MKSTLWSVSLFALALVLSACGGEAFVLPAPSGSPNNAPPGTGGSGQPNWLITSNALVTAGLVEQTPAPADTFNGVVALSHLGVTQVTRGYEFSTPANQPFNFNVIARELSNSGTVTVRVGHSPGTNAETIQTAGMLIDAPGLTYEGKWWRGSGDGVVAMSVRGSISSDQVLIFQTTTSKGVEVIGVRLKVGGYSGIYISGYVGGAASVVGRTTIYSSNDQGFGLPAIAVSGDRYSITAYDGDSVLTRRRTWLQMDTTSGAVTGGEEASASPDSGSWRDQEIAALNNVLCVAYTGNHQVQVEISLDRGASFGTPVILNEQVGGSVGAQRLVQVEIAGDYTLAVAYWRTIQSGTTYTSQLCVAEGSPTGFDANNTPTGYSFGAPWIVHTPGGPVVPVVMDLEYSTAGDLVVGYAYNQITMGSMTLNSRCATRLKIGTVTDYLIDSETSTWGCDPNISIIGTGVGMRIFYAYERSDGIRLIELRNLGAIPFGSSNGASIGRVGAYSPSVHARMQGTELRVDLMYLVPSGYGWSLVRMHWDDWDSSMMATSDELFSSSQQTGGTPYGTIPGLLVKTIGFMGYDAAIIGDNVAISLHTETIDLFAGIGASGSSPPQSPPVYYGSGTATLLPGMTGTVPAPNAAHRHQLEVIVID